MKKTIALLTILFTVLSRAQLTDRPVTTHTNNIQKTVLKSTHKLKAKAGVLTAEETQVVQHSKQGGVAKVQISTNHVVRSFPLMFTPNRLKN